MTDTEWAEEWRDTSRVYYGVKLRVRWNGKPNDWTARVEGEAKPTHHTTRKLAQKAAEKRARALAS